MSSSPNNEAGTNAAHASITANVEHEGSNTKTAAVTATSSSENNCGADREMKKAEDGKESATKKLTASLSPSPSTGGPTSASGAGAGTKSLKKAARKKRKPLPNESAQEEVSANGSGPMRKVKKLKRKKDKDDLSESASKNSVGGNNTAAVKKKMRKQPKKPAAATSVAALAHLDQPLSPAQIAVNEQMRKALEEDQYSANGSIVDTDTDDDDHQYVYKGQSVRLDRNYLLQAAKKHVWLGGGVHAGKSQPGTSNIQVVDEDFDEDDEDEEILSAGDSTMKKSSKSSKSSKDKKKRGRNQYTGRGKGDDGVQKDAMEGSGMSRDLSGSSSADDVMERDEGSIFGQTTGASNSTWVECDKCKKWRRLRGVVDERKLPPKWYCSMNKNDPERARCSAPEEEYDAAHTPESAADARTRKHLRVWVRRLQCNEQYESRQPTLTRGKKRAAASSSKEPHEWIRCCNPSCGKWRAVLRIMDAKQNVIDRTNNGEWYCVMNTWDEKTASCAAPQENLPAVGCPPWVMQDEN